jgi:hypothetical protein
MALNFPSSPSGNQIYSSGGSSWIWTGYAWRIYSPSGSGIRLDDLDDVNVSSASVGQVLVYNGTEWYADSNDLVATGVYMTSNQNASGLFYVNFSSVASGIDFVKTDNDFLWNSNTNSLVLASGSGVLQAIIDGGIF